MKSIKVLAVILTFLGLFTASAAYAWDENGNHAALSWVRPEYRQAIETGNCNLCHTRQTNYRMSEYHLLRANRGYQMKLTFTLAAGGQYSAVSARPVIERLIKATGYKWYYDADNQRVFTTANMRAWAHIFETSPYLVYR